MLRNLELIGIKKVRDYRLGDWFGNSTSSGYQVYHHVTHNISDLLHSFEIRYRSEKRLVYVNDFKCLNAREIGHPTYGRCFEIKLNLQQTEDTIYSVDIQIKKSIYVFVNLPNLFFNEDSRTKCQVNNGHDLFLDITYEILQNNFKKRCKKYPKTYHGSYDDCKMKQIEKRIVSMFNCTIPFINKPNLTKEICTGKNALNASKNFKIFANMLMESCPDPCINMLSSYGFPTGSRSVNDSGGRVRLYFKSIVKFTEDFVSYNFLRFVQEYSIYCIVTLYLNHKIL